VPEPEELEPEELEAGPELVVPEPLVPEVEVADVDVAHAAVLSPVDGDDAPLPPPGGVGAPQPAASNPVERSSPRDDRRKERSSLAFTSVLQTTPVSAVV
jgi:hypothetical protein